MENCVFKDLSINQDQNYIHKLIYELFNNLELNTHDKMLIYRFNIHTEEFKNKIIELENLLKTINFKILIFVNLANISKTNQREYLYNIAFCVNDSILDDQKYLNDMMIRDSQIMLPNKVNKSSKYYSKLEEKYVIRTKDDYYNFDNLIWIDNLKYNLLKNQIDCNKLINKYNLVPEN